MSSQSTHSTGSERSCLHRSVAAPGRVGSVRPPAASCAVACHLTRKQRTPRGRCWARHHLISSPIVTQTTGRALVVPVAHAFRVCFRAGTGTWLPRGGRSSIRRRGWCSAGAVHFSSALPCVGQGEWLCTSGRASAQASPTRTLAH